MNRFINLCSCEKTILCIRPIDAKNVKEISQHVTSLCVRNPLLLYSLAYDLDLEISLLLKDTVHTQIKAALEQGNVIACNFSCPHSFPLLWNKRENWREGV